MAGFTRSVTFASIFLLTIVPNVSAATMLVLVSRDDAYVDGTEISSNKALAISPDGLHVYSLDSRGGLATFSRDPVTGLLTAIDLLAAEGQPDAEALGLSPDGAFLYVGSEGVSGDGAIIIFGRDTTTGQLTFLTEMQDLLGVESFDPTAIAITPSGENLYLAVDNTGPFPFYSTAIVVLGRDTATGMLNVVDTFRYSDHGLDYFSDIRSLAISPDGQSLYAASGRLVVFGIGSPTGSLSQVQVHQDYSESVAVSPDGVHVYAAGSEGLRIYSRSGLTGALTVLHQEFEFDARYLAISPDGSRVYSASGGDILLSDRNAATGLLTSVSLEGGPNRGMIVSPDGLHVYRPSQGGPAVYKHITAACTAAPAAGCLSPGDESRLVIKDTESRKSMVWKWTSSGTISDQFGSPATSDNHYALCMYQGAPAPALVSESIAPAATRCGGSACWQNFNGRRLMYVDKFPERHGVRTLIAQEGSGRAQITLKSTGATVPPPSLPVTLPLEVQLQTSEGPCWSAVFTDARKNTNAFLRAVTP